MGCSQTLTVGTKGVQVDLVMIRLVDTGFNGMFSNPPCRYTRLRGESDFNKIGGHEFQWDVLKSSLYVYRAYRWTMSQQVDLVLLRLVDMRFNGMFSNHHYVYRAFLIRLVAMSFNRMFSNPHCLIIGPD